MDLMGVRSDNEQIKQKLCEMYSQLKLTELSYKFIDLVVSNME